MYSHYKLTQYSYPVTSPVPAPSSNIVISLCPSDSIFYRLCTLNESNVGTIIQDIIILVIIIAIAFALIFLIIGGFRWIMSQGEEESVKKARNTLISAVIGLIFVFLSFFILALVVHFFVPNFNLTSFTLPSL